MQITLLIIWSRALLTVWNFAWRTTAWMMLAVCSQFPSLLMWTLSFHLRCRCTRKEHRHWCWSLETEPSLLSAIFVSLHLALAGFGDVVCLKGESRWTVISAGMKKQLVQQRRSSWAARIVWLFNFLLGSKVLNYYKISIEFLDWIQCVVYVRLLGVENMELVRTCRDLGSSLHTYRCQRSGLWVQYSGWWKGNGHSCFRKCQPKAIVTLSA